MPRRCGVESEGDRGNQYAGGKKPDVGNFGKRKDKL